MGTSTRRTRRLTCIPRAAVVWLLVRQVIREDFMARDPDNVGFNVVALCKLD